MGALTDSKNSINVDYVNRCIAQVNLGRTITKISPASLYQNASEVLIGTGIARFRKIYNQLNRYKETLKNFLVEEDNKDPDSWHLLAEGTPPDILLSKKSVDFNAIPKFVELDSPMSEAVMSAVWDIFALILLNVCLFMAAYVSFLRCDVR